MCFGEYLFIPPWPRLPTTSTEARCLIAASHSTYLASPSSTSNSTSQTCNSIQFNSIQLQFEIAFCSLQMFKLFYTISVLSANHWIIFDYIIASSHSFKLRFKRSRHAKSGNSNSIVTDFELQISLAILIVLAAFLFKSPSKAW